MKKLLACAIIISLLFHFCTPVTHITGSWVDPAANTRVKGYNSVLLASLSRNMEVRTKLEDALAKEAGNRSIKAVKSTDILSPDFYQGNPSQQDLLSKIRSTGVDAILTVSLIDRESETQYVRGTTRYAPYPLYSWYGSFYGYYNYWRPYLYDPGYYVTNKTYFLETNLYDAATEKLIWSAQSETVNPSGIDQFVKTYPKVLVAQMMKDGLQRSGQ